MTKRPLVSGWPAQPVDVALSDTAHRLFLLSKPAHDRLADRSAALARVPARIARIVLDQFLDPLFASGRIPRSTLAARVWEHALSLASHESKTSGAHVQLHRMFLVDDLFHNVATGALREDDVLRIAEHGAEPDRCLNVLMRLDLARICVGMNRSRYFHPWQANWLMQAGAADYIDGHSTVPVQPRHVTSLEVQMPLHGQVFRYAYQRWLDRKDWRSGERMSREPDPHAPTFERPNAFMAAWLPTVRLAVGKEVDLAATLGEVVSDLNARGHGALVESMFGGLCDEQIYRLIFAAYKALEFGPPWARFPWGWNVVTHLERVGQFPLDLAHDYFNPDAAGMQLVADFLRTSLMRLASDQPMDVFFSRAPEADGYRELEPGWPSSNYLEGDTRRIHVLGKCEHHIIVWGTERRTGPLIDGPVRCDDFAAELLAKSTNRVDAKVYGVVYGPSCSAERPLCLQDVVASAYAYAQHELLFFVDAIRQHGDVDSWVGPGPIAVIHGWERHIDSEPGAGAEVLRAVAARLASTYPNLSSVVFEVEPLQFCQLAGGEPQAILDARSAAFRKIVRYVRSCGALSPLGNTPVLFVDPKLHGDLTSVLRDADLGPVGEQLVQYGLRTRAVFAFGR